MDRTNIEAIDPLPHSSTWTVGQPNDIELKKSVTILFNAEEEHGVVRLSQSDTSFERSQTPYLSAAKFLRRTQSVNIVPTSASAGYLQTDISQSAMTILSGATTAIHSYGSTSTIESAELDVTESRSSGYTTDSSYQTATAGSNYSLTSSIYQSTPRSNYTDNYIRDIHVGMEPNATETQILAIRDDLRSLLSNEVAMIHDASGGSRRAVYLIAYQYM